MKKVLLFVSFFPVLPTLALAQTLSAQSFISRFLKFANAKLIPALLGVAFLLFAINVIRFFVIQGGEEDGRKNAKNLALYSVLAFVVIIIFWGVVNLFSSSIGLNAKSTPTPDYLELNNAKLNSTSAKGSTGAPLDPNCPNGATGLGKDGNPCGIY